MGGKVAQKETVYKGSYGGSSASSVHVLVALLNPESLASQSLIGRTAVHNGLRFGKAGARALPCDSRYRWPQATTAWPDGHEFRGASRRGHQKRQIRRRGTLQAKDCKQIPRIWVWLRFQVAPICYGAKAR
jgi:hypothetical protein